MIYLNGANYPYPEQISMVPKIFEPLSDFMLPSETKKAVSYASIVILSFRSSHKWCLSKCYDKVITTEVVSNSLTFTAIYANSADYRLIICFVIFPEKKTGISCKLSFLYELSKLTFWGKKEKECFKMSSVVVFTHHAER